MDITELTYTKFGKIIFTIISYLKIEVNTNANDLHFFFIFSSIKTKLWNSIQFIYGIFLLDFLVKTLKFALCFIPFML